MTGTPKLNLALSKVQGKIENAKKTSDNPFFKSKYADLATVWDACRDVLAENEIAVVQLPCVVDGVLGINTSLRHSSGEQLDSFLPISAPLTAKAQEMGSAITYARRYSLAAMVGIAQEDDDGNAAQKAGAPSKITPHSEDGLDEADGCYNALNTASTLEAFNKVLNHKKTGDLLVKLANGNDAQQKAHKKIQDLIDKQREELK